MIALDQTRGTLRRAQRMLVCLMLAGVAGLGHAQEGAVKTGSQEGTLVVNYYSTAPDPELEQLRGLAIDAIGVYLRGEMRVEDNDIGWSSSVRNVGKDMERIVRDLMRIRAFAGQEDFKGFSEEVAMLLVDFEELDMRDVERMRGSGTRSFEERTYVLIEQRVQEILLQCGWSLDATSTAACSKKSAPSSKACPWRSCRGGPTPMRMCRLNRLSSTSIWKPCRCWTAKTKALGPRRAGMLGLAARMRPNGSPCRT